MAYEFLKKLFGTPKDGEEPKAMTYAELEAAIDADKKIQVVDNAFSGSIPIVCEITNNGNSWTYSHLRVYNGIIVGYWN